MRKAWMLLLALFLISVGGCAYTPGYGPYGGGHQEIVPDQRVPISESLRGGGKWSSNDLSITYRYVPDANGLLFSGTLEFIDAINYNFPLMPYFHAGLIFGDARGGVIGSTPLLTTRRDSSFDTLEPIKFSRHIVLPPGAAMFAFSYQGQLAETGGRGIVGGMGGSNPTNIWNYPVRSVAVVQQQK